MNQQLAVALLEGEGHAVTVANNGREAVAAAETGDFDLVLMDLQMPEMDGLEATAIIRASEREQRPSPSHHRHDRARPEGRSRALPGGRHGRLYLQADRRRGTVCGDREPGLPPAEAGHCGSGRNPDRSRTPAAAWSPDTADRSIGPRPCKAVRGDDRLLETIVETALGEIPNLLAEIRRAAAAGDARPSAWRRTRSKDRSAILGPAACWNRPMRLEAMGQNGHLEGAGEVLPVLDQSAGQLMAALAERMLDRQYG